MNFVSETATRIKTFCVLPIVLLFAVGAFGKADSPHEEIAKALRSVQTTIELADAELELEAYYLTQIEQLRQNRHASWLELAKQKSVVQTLQTQRSEFKQYLDYLADIETQIYQANLSEDSLSGLGAWTVHVPGSNRVLGWIEADEKSVVNDLAKIGSNNFVNERLNENSRKSLIQNRKHQIEKLERQHADKDLLNSLPNHWQNQLKLQLRKAKAQLRLETLKGASMQDPVELAVSHESLKNYGGIVDSTFDRDTLAGLERQISLLEVNSTSQLQWLRLKLEREKARLSLLNDLVRRGISQANGVRKTRESINDLQTEIDDEVDRRLQLADAFRNRFGSDWSQSDLTESLDFDRTTPIEILSNANRLRYLLDNRRNQTRLKCLIAAQASEIKLKREVLSRLLEANEKTESNLAGQDMQIAEVLHKGQIREIKSTQLELRIQQAKLDLLQEDLQLVELHQALFVKVWSTKSPGNDIQFVSVSSASPTHDTTTSYVPIGELVRKDIFLRSVTSDYYDLGLASRSGPILRGTSGLPAQILPSVKFRSTKRKSRSIDQEFGRNSFEFRQPNLPQPFTWGHRNNNSTSSTQYNYPNGALRLELRSRVPVGQIPWYLPGLPTNVR